MHKLQLAGLHSTGILQGPLHGPSNRAVTVCSVSGQRYWPEPQVKGGQFEMSTAVQQRHGCIRQQGLWATPPRPAAESSSVSYFRVLDVVVL